MARAEHRRQVISATLDRIRAIEAAEGITKAALAAIEGELLGLAEEVALFTLEDFPPPAAGDDSSSHLYLLAEDPDGRFALYAQSCLPGIDVPPHNHTTWAVITGIEGVEENRFYERGPDGPEMAGRREVCRGVAVGLLPDELHSIHIHGRRPVLNFHMYGLALDRLATREFWEESSGTWKIFPAQQGIIDRRAG
jgi:hypothetical protein